MSLILESEKAVRHLGNNPLDFLMNNIIQNNLFVSIGYFKEAELSVGPRTRKVVNSDNDEKLTNFLSGEEINNTPRFKSKLERFKQSDKYQTALTTGKTAPLECEGHLIKIGRCVVRWMQNDKLAQQYKDWNEEEVKLRVKHGFGKDDADYAEDDWRRKAQYKGTSKYPETRAGKGAFYNTAMGQSGMWSSSDDPSKIALRQFGNLKLTSKPQYFYVDEDSNIEKIDNSLMRFLMEEYSKKKVVEVVNEINDEEKAFLADLEKLNKKRRSEVTYLLDNILYITGTSVNMRGEKEPFTWINDTMIYTKYPWIPKEFIQETIAKYVDFSEEEISSISESIDKLSKHLLKLNEHAKAKRSARKLNESATHKSTKRVKLNEYKKFDDTITIGLSKVKNDNIELNIDKLLLYVMAYHVKDIVINKTDLDITFILRYDSADWRDIYYEEFVRNLVECYNISEGELIKMLKDFCKKILGVDYKSYFSGNTDDNIDYTNEVVQLNLDKLTYAFNRIMQLNIGNRMLEFFNENYSEDMDIEDMYLKLTQAFKAK